MRKASLLCRSVSVRLCSIPTDTECIKARSIKRTRQSCLLGVIHLFIGTHSPYGPLRLVILLHLFLCSASWTDFVSVQRQQCVNVTFLLVFHEVENLQPFIASVVRLSSCRMCPDSSSFLWFIKSTIVQCFLRFYSAVLNAGRSSREKVVCLSVCQTRGLWQNGRKICPAFYTIWKII